MIFRARQNELSARFGFELAGALVNLLEQVWPEGWERLLNISHDLQTTRAARVQQDFLLAQATRSPPSMSA